MELPTTRLSWAEELRIAEEQTPGYKASKGPGNTVTLTPTAEYVKEMAAQRTQMRIGQSAELATAINSAAK